MDGDSIKKKFLEITNGYSLEELVELGIINDKTVREVVFMNEVQMKIKEGNSLGKAIAVVSEKITLGVCSRQARRLHDKWKKFI